MNKLVPIAGDMSLPSLGVSTSDIKILSDNVSIVFHSAATVKFDEALKSAVEMNLKGTMRLIELCRKMNRLDVYSIEFNFLFLSRLMRFVSLCFAGSDPRLNSLCQLRQRRNRRNDLPTASRSQKTNRMRRLDGRRTAEKHHQKVMKRFNDFFSLNLNFQTILIWLLWSSRLVGKRPNTYTYTKALAEHLLLEECGSIPLAIVRPTIVTAAMKEPIPGWVDNLNGPTGRREWSL